METPTLWVLLISLMVLAGVVLAGTRVRAIRRKRRSKEVEPKRCVCGYEMTGLSLPRCPECGRLDGFDKTFEELGLTEDDMARIAMKRQAREQSGNEAKESRRFP